MGVACINKTLFMNTKLNFCIIIMGHRILLFFWFFSNILKVLKHTHTHTHTKTVWVCGTYKKKGAVRFGLGPWFANPWLGPIICHSLGLSTLELQGKVCVCVCVCTNRHWGQGWCGGYIVWVTNSLRHRLCCLKPILVVCNSPLWGRILDVKPPGM